MWKYILAIVGIVLIWLGLLTVSILGIVYGSIWLAHGMVNAKSICFVVFGSCGVLLFGPSIRITHSITE